MDNPGESNDKQTLNENNNFVDWDVTTNCDVTNGKTQYKWYSINWSMVPTKLAYFFECGRRLGFAPNLVLFFISIGLNKEESGFIVGLR